MPLPLRRRLQTLKTLLAALLVLASVAPAAFARVTASWMCEGRVCGFTQFYCCCDTPTLAGRDSRCARVGAVPADTGARLCAAPCNCRLVLSAADGTQTPLVSTAPPAPVYPPLLALPPSTPLCVPAPVVRECTAAQIEARGPPAVRSVAASPASPRAPPHA